jgi:hypothetical protein
MANVQVQGMRHQYAAHPLQRRVRFDEVIVEKSFPSSRRPHNSKE